MLLAVALRRLPYAFKIAFKPRMLSDSSHTVPSLLTGRAPLSPEIEECHRAAVEDMRTTYVDPETGFNVFTSIAHKKRGTCCGNVCRHCPFDYVNVKEKKLKQLCTTGA